MHWKLLRPLSQVANIFKKAAKWVGKNAKKIATVALPLAGVAVGLVAPGVGAAIGKVADKLGNKISEATGIGDGKPGVFGIGDGLPGIFGIGDGDAALAKLKKEIESGGGELLNTIKTKLNKGEPLSAPEKLAYEQAKKDMKGDGINPLFLIGGGLLALFAFRK